MSTTVSRDNFAVISAVVKMENPDTAKELETQIAEKILENGKSEYSNFSADVTLKETDAENKTADYTVEISYTDYGEFYEGCPSHDYYDPPDPDELYMDDVDDVLYNMKNCIEKLKECAVNHTECDEITVPMLYNQHSDLQIEFRVKPMGNEWVLDADAYNEADEIMTPVTGYTEDAFQTLMYDDMKKDVEIGLREELGLDNPELKGNKDSIELY